MEKSLKDLQAEVVALQTHIQQLYASYQGALIKVENKLATEELLKESDDRFRKVFEQSNVAHKIIDTDLKMVDINSALCNMLGYTKDEILGTTILDYTHPDFVAHWYDLHDALWKKELPFFHLEACLINKEKMQIWCRVNTIRFQDQGKTHGFSILEDITEKKQLERHKDDFISVVSHELKTPLTSMKMRCQLLLNKLLKNEDDFGITMATGINKQIDMLTKLISDLVVVSRIENSKLEPIVVPYNLNELLSEVTTEFNSLIADRMIRVQASEQLHMHGDQNRVRQVIYNLISNAVKFSAGDTTIDITVRQKDSMAMMCIQDHGRGIPKKSIEKVFDRFYKAETISNNLEPGLGVGLFICAEIIKSQNGKLWVESVPNKGSTFCFTLPMLRL